MGCGQDAEGRSASHVSSHLKGYPDQKILLRNQKSSKDILWPLLAHLSVLLLQLMQPALVTNVVLLQLLQQRSRARKGK